MKLSRKWILVAALVMSVAMATSGTLAYLTDRDSEVNVFTFGNVDIELNEEFEQTAQLVPGVTIEKAATITNVGKNDAWVWYTLAIPTALDSEAASNNVIHTNVPGRNWFGYHTNQNYWLEGQTEAVPDEKTWIVDAPVFANGAKSIKTEINGVECTMYAHLYKGVLPVGETTTVGLSQVYLDYHIDIDPEGNLHHVENGVVTDIDWNINEDGVPAIYLAAYAIQKDGFDTVEEAFAAYATQWGENGGVEYSSNLTAADNSELEEALAATKNGVVTLTDNISYDALTINDDQNVTLLLNENTLTVPTFVTEGTAEINGGTLESTESAAYGARTTIGGETTYTDLSVTTKGGGVNVWGTAVWNSGSIVTNSESTSARHVFYVAGGEGATGHLTINGGEFTFSPTNLTRKGSYICAQGADATVIVNGGTFHKPSTRTAPIQAIDGATVIIYGGKFAFDPSGFVADGYQAVKGADGYWTVSK